MTKLVRLESDDVLSESQFTNNLAVALQLGKNAKVALKTLTMQFKEPPLIVNSNNNTINYSTSADAPIMNLRTVTISSGTYTVFELVKEFEKRMNSLLQSHDDGTSDLGFEWSVDQTGDVANGYNTNIAYTRTDNASVNTADCDLKINNVQTMQFNTPNFLKSIADNTTYNAALVTKRFLNRGAWKISMQVVPQNSGQSQNINASKWTFGIGANDLKNETSESGTVSKMLCGVMRGSNGNYWYKAGGIMHDTSVGILANDLITISKKLISGTETQVVYGIKQGTNAVVEFNGDSIPNSALENISLGGQYLTLKVGDDTGKIAFTNLNYTPTGSIAVNSGIYTRLYAQNVQNVMKNDNLAISPSTVTVFFPTEQVRILLGFPVPFVSSSELTHNFVSTDKISFNIFNNDIMVEIPELPLNGYDQYSKQTRNIIMVVSSGEVRNSVTARGSETYELSFTESATPLFVGIKNRQTTFTTPALSLRITSEGKTLQMEGKISALLLFKDEDDD